MGMITRILLVVCTAALVAGVSVGILDLELGQVDYWSRHGFWLLVGLALFPRLTLLFSSIPFGGVLWWLGWIFAPRFLVAILATLAYWQPNPALVLFAWFFAIGGETGEKIIMRRQVITIRSPRQSTFWHARIRRLS